MACVRHFVWLLLALLSVVFGTGTLPARVLITDYDGRTAPSIRYDGAAAPILGYGSALALTARGKEIWTSRTVETSGVFAKSVEFFAAEEGLAATSGRTILNPVAKPSSWFEYWQPRYNPQPLVFDGQASTAIHEGQHVADILAHPQLTSLANHSYFPGAGFARYWFEYRAWAAEGALSSPLTPFNSFNLNHAVNFGADVGVFVGLPAAAGYSIYQGTR